MMLLTEERFYTIEQVAERLQVHRETVRRALVSGKLDGVRIGSDWRIGENALQAWIRPRKKNTNEQ